MSDFFGPFQVLTRLAGIVREEPFTGLSGSVYSQTVERTGTDSTWYLKQAGVTPGSMLDLCCGSGRHLSAFADAGWDCVGVDISPGMLRRAATRLRSPAKLVEADALTLSLGQTFDCVLIGGLSITLFPPEQRERLLSVARTHLRPGGVLLLDFSPRSGSREPTEHVVGVPLTNGFAWIGWRRDERVGRQWTNTYVELVAPDGTTRRALSSLDFVVLAEADLTGDLARHGFAVTDGYDPHPAGPPYRLLSCAVNP